ncbi:DNA fragmentation factor subunit beta-like isoform X3 [Thrips palmi]|nr:DNA fragmentation factor subunit beta-like isoform X3 [Thrips palmi]XP_034243572.1 DNA fragmentation factor subunit beta-like isoform X3 [Thrips palmi]XP_034243573.1 DNA fragmentation factor subunit beta-like isoform X3 [Thrips palmi]
MNGYKVTDGSRSRICGIACKTLQQLKEKGCSKLKLDSSSIVVRLQDGTIVDDNDYFKTLAPQTIFILSPADMQVATGYELLYNMLCAVHKDYLNVGKLASDFLSQDLKAKIRDVSSALECQSTKERAKLSKRDDDPAWFEGLETIALTKEDFMFRRSQERIRGYLYKSQDDIKKSILYVKDSKARAKLDATFNHFKECLKKVNHFGCYFSRCFSSNEGPLKSYCDEDGQFKCQGKWNENNCQHLETLATNGNAKHFINPYESKEARIVFSTWNLDHRIERSRRIGPALLEAAKLAVHNNEDINAMYFFTLLFTSKNLKLVHIVCHDKGEHHGADCISKRLTINKSVKSDFNSIFNAKNSVSVA